MRQPRSGGIFAFLLLVCVAMPRPAEPQSPSPVELVAPTEADGILSPTSANLNTVLAAAALTQNNLSTVSLSEPATATEGENITFTVRLDNPVPEAFSLGWVAKSSGTHAATVVGQVLGVSDLRALAPNRFSNRGTVAIPANQTSATFSIAVVDDVSVEEAETFTVNLVGSARHLRTIDPDDITIDESANNATGTIIDNDSVATEAVVNIGGRAVVTEGNNAIAGIILTRAVSSDVVVAISYAPGTATSTREPASIEDDLVASNLQTTVTVPALSAAIPFSIPINDDDIIEGDEVFTVTVQASTETPLPPGVTISPNDTGMITIKDNDPFGSPPTPRNARVSIAPEADTQTEGDSFNFEVRLSEAVDEAVSVTWTAVAGTAAVRDPNSDLVAGQAITGTATFAASTTTAVAVAIATLDDEVAEGEEAFTVTLSEPSATPLPDGVSFGTQTATATITDNDMAEVSIAPSADTQAEGDAFAFEVRLSKEADENISVTWTATAGTATIEGANSDLAVNQDITGTATFTAGTTTAVAVDIDTLDDDVVEGEEAFTVALTGTLPDGVEYGTQTATATITDNDAAELSIETSATAAEGSPVEFEVSLSAASAEPVTVRWTLTATGDSAATLEGANSDLGTGQDTSGTVEFSANDTADKTVSITTTDDDRVEGSETFTVTLSPDDDNPLPDEVAIPTATAAGTGTITEDDAATVSIAPEADTQTEGGSFAFEVRLSAPVNEAVNVTWTAVAGTAAVQDPNSDLATNQDITGTATFAAGTTTAVAVPINTLDDDRVEGEEAFTVALTGTLPDGVDYGTQTATATITDNDMAEVSIAPSADTQAEGDAFAFEVRLSKEADENISVTWTATAGTATIEGANSDLAVNQDITGTATFTAGTTTAVAVDIDTLDDDVVEGEEAFTVALTGTLPDGVEYGTQSATATITDNDAAELSIETSATAAEGSPVEFEVSLSAASAEPVTVRWTLTATGDSAATLEGANSDLGTGQDTSGTVEFTANDTADKTVSITTTDDDRVEGSETFTVTLSPDDDNPLPDEVAIPTATEAGTGTITEDDAATVSIAPEADTQTEGGSFAFEVRLSAPVNEAVNVTWTAVAGTAAVQDPNSDLATNQDITGTATFTAGTTTAVAIAIATLDDDVVEGEEAFTVTLTGALPDGVDYGTQTATATITDNDEAPPPVDEAVINLRAVADVSEADNRLTFRAELTERLSQDVSVSWEVTGGTASASDFTGFASSGTVTIQVDRGGAPIRFRPFDDDIVEGSETLELTISEIIDTPLPAGVTIGTTMATGTLTDNDMATVSIAPEAATQTEGGSFAFEVRLSAPVDEAISVTWTAVAGTAAVQDPNSDLADGQDITGTATFAAGTTTAVAVPIATLDDDRVEGEEAFTVTLTGTLPDGVDYGTRTASAAITDNDKATVSIAPEAATQTEGGSFAFEVRLSAPVDEAVNVTWTAVAGTAAVQGPNSDLAVSQDITGTATFAAGTTTAVAVPIATLDDDRVEGEEAFTVTLTGTLPDGVDYGTRTATATITDNDMATVSIAPEAATQTEGGSFAFEVRLSAPVDEAVSVTWTAVAGTAAVRGANSDLATGQDITGTATFTAGTTTAVAIPINTLDDNRAEGEEAFTVTLSGTLPDGVDYGTRTATATITDNDRATVSIAPQAATQTEGGSFAFEVRLSAPVDGAVSVTWTAVAGTAAVRDPNSDLATGQDITGTATFATGTTTAVAVPIATLDDDRVEGEEAFTVTLSGTLPDGVDYGTRTATATITDDDMATVSIAPEADTQTEGDPFAFEVRLSQAVDEAVSVTWTAVAGTAAVQDPNSDLAVGQDITGTATFTAGSTTAVAVAINTLDDDVAEGEEAFTVTLTGTLPDGVDYGTQTATATITDNDMATVSIAPEADTQTEGGSFAFEVRLSQAVDEGISVTWTAVAGTAAVQDPNSDLAVGQDITGTATFTAGSTTAVAVAINTLDDHVAEGEEAFTVTLTGTLPDGVDYGTQTATATITDNDMATVSIAPEADTQTEGGSFAFEVRLSQAVDEGISVTWTAVAGTAAVQDPNSDLAVGQDITGTATFTAGSTTAVAVAINTLDDDVAEGEEAFTVTLTGTLPDGVDYGTQTATATITDNDMATVSIAPEADTQTEGNPFAFEVRLNQAVDEPISVTWTAVAGTAAVQDPNSDLAANQDITGTATFAAGTTTAVAIPIATLDDDRVEGEEAFTVTLSGDLPDGVMYGTQTATATITDNDRAPPPGDDALVSIAATTGSAAEGQTLAFAVRLSRAVDAPMTIRWTAAGGTATLRGPSSDLAAGAATTGTVAFAAGNTAPKRFTIATRADDFVEGNETFEVRVTAVGELPDGVSISPTANVSLATITETMTAAVSLAPAALSRMEGDDFTFAVRLEHRVTQPVAVRWTAAGGTATLSGSGSDLEDGQKISGAVSIAAGTREATFTLDTREDAEVEADETFTVTISAADTLPAGVSMSGTVNRATGTILNDDVATELSIGDASVIEGGRLRFPYTLSEAVNSTVSFTYTTADGTATVTNADYTPTTDGQVSIPANTTEGVIEVPTTADEFVEANETLTLILIDIERADNGVVSFINEVATGTIVNDDFAEVSIAPSEVSAAEGRTLAFEVRLDKAVDEEVTVSWTAAGAGGNPATLSGETSDLEAEVATRGTVTFAARDTAPQPLRIATRTDPLVEGDETFEVRLAADSLPAAVSLDKDPATGTIADLTSVLIEPRRTGAATALRRHVGRFEMMTSAVVRGRLAGRAAPGLSVSGNLGHPGNAGTFGNARSFGNAGNYGNPGNFGSPGNSGNSENFGNPGNGALMIGGGFAETGLGAWTDGAYTGFRGRATGRQADIYAGLDYLGGSGKWLIGALVGQDFADLDAGDANYRANYTQVGAYGGVRLSQRLIFDGAATYGIATPEIRQGEVSASYEASRITLRAGLTGDVGLAYGLGGGKVTITPQMNASWAREQLGGFTDSAGRIAASETLELGRLSAGPRVTWDMGGSQLVGGVRLQWDFVQPDDIAEKLSTAADIGLLFALTPGIQIGLTGDVDGIGIADDFMTFGGGVQLRFNFARNIAMALLADVDGIGALDGQPNPGGRFEITIGR